MRMNSVSLMAFVSLSLLVFFQSCRDEKQEVLPPPVPDQSFVEEFDNIGSASSKGWKFINHSEPVGMRNWFQGNSSYFPAYSGGSYIACDFAAVDDNGTISVWAVSPSITLQNGDKIVFYTRSANSNSNPASVFPDRLQLRFSRKDTVDVGTAATDVGAFKDGLVDINPNLDVSSPVTYPDAWTRFEGTIYGLNKPTQGRFAFRYFVEDGGASGLNGLAVGIDKVSYVGKK